MPSAAEALRAGAAALGVDFPLVQAGMGGVATPALAAAVSNAGALGTVALYKTDGAQAAAVIEAAARGTERPFGVNVIPEVADRLLAEQVTAFLRSADRGLVLNSYGLPPGAVAGQVLAAGHRLIVQVGTAADAVAAAGLGAHLLVVQGTDAGGHHLGTVPLAQALAEVHALGLGVPLLAAGGIHTGADLLRAVRLGAAGCLCGTAFVAAAESAAHPAYRAALVAADGADTVVTGRFSIGWPGRPHRTLRSAVTDAPTTPPARFIAWTTVMAGGRRPVPRGSAAAPTVDAEGRVEEMARYAGTGVGHVVAVEPAAAIVGRIRAEFTAEATAESTVGSTAAPAEQPGAGRERPAAVLQGGSS